MPMVSLKLMAGAASDMVVASARTTAAEIAARAWGWFVNLFMYRYRTGTGKKTPGGAGSHTEHTRDTRAHTGNRITVPVSTTFSTVSWCLLGLAGGGAQDMSHCAIEAPWQLDELTVARDMLREVTT